VLRLLAYLFGKIAEVRNALYDKGVLDVHDLGARTISVGNITTGGTGKTPLVANIAEVLAARGEKVCILTRGYGRDNAKLRILVSDGERVLVDAREGGDEPVELAHKLIGKAIIIADADRVSAAEWALRKFDVSVFLLDDGFQHRKVKRDLDIVCIDATNPFGGGRTLPVGRLRESPAGLARADAIIITRSDLASDATALRSELVESNPKAVIFEAKSSITAITPIDAFRAKTRTAHAEKITGPVFAFCGIGNPENFFELLRRKKGVAAAAGSKAFADHHEYTQSDVTRIEVAARSSGAEILLTTAKDAVKLSDVTFRVPCYVVETEMEVDNVDEFEALLISSCHPSKMPGPRAHRQPRR
jgi:tetraacyldisaccharide 4'-kinase